MSDIAQILQVRDVDLRVVVVLTTAILVSEIGSAYEIVGLLIVGIVWAFITTPDSAPIINACVNNFEYKIKPVVKSRIWIMYVRPIIYLLFIMGVTYFAVV